MHPTTLTLNTISSPLRIPWNIVALKVRRWPSGGSNTGCSGHTLRIVGFTQPDGVTRFAELRMSPAGLSRCRNTSAKRVWFQPVVWMGNLLSRAHNMCGMRMFIKCKWRGVYVPSPALTCARSTSSSPSWTLAPGTNGTSRNERYSPICVWYGCWLPPFANVPKVRDWLERFNSLKYIIKKYQKLFTFPYSHQSSANEFEPPPAPAPYTAASTTHLLPSSFR